MSESWSISRTHPAIPDAHAWVAHRSELSEDDSINTGEFTLAVRWICHCGAVKTVLYQFAPSNPEDGEEQRELARTILARGRLEKFVEEGDGE